MTCRPPLCVEMVRRPPPRLLPASLPAFLSLPRRLVLGPRRLLTSTRLRPTVRRLGRGLSWPLSVQRLRAPRAPPGLTWRTPRLRLPGLLAFLSLAPARGPTPTRTCDG